MKSIQTFLESFNCIPFEEKPQILFQTWETFFAIQCSQPEDSNELFQKLLKDLKELAEYDQSTNIHQLIDECCEGVPEEQKQKIEDTIALDSKLLSINSINSQRLDKKEQEVKIVEEQPAERRNRIEKSLQKFRVVHKNSISLNTSQISSIHEVAPILSTKEPENSLMNARLLQKIRGPDSEIVSIEEENGVEEENVVQREEEEVNLEEISQVKDVVLCEKLFSITRLISNIESLNDNSTLDRVLNSFESDNSLLDNFLPEFETFCDHSKETRSGNTTHANYSLPEYDLFCFKIEPDQERLINLMKNDISDSSNDPLLEEVDLFLSDNSIPPGIENVADDPEGDIQPPDDNFDLEPEVISAVMKDNDEPDEYFNLGGEIFVSTNNADVDYFPFMFVIRIFLPYLILHVISPLFLSAESEDMIFDPGLSPEIEVFLVLDMCLVFKTFAPEDSEVFKVYFKGLLINDHETVETSFGGIGVAICDLDDYCLFEVRKQVTISRDIEGDVLIGLARPTNTTIMNLVNDFLLIGVKFSFCFPYLVNQNNFKFAYNLAKEAGASQKSKYAESASHKTMALLEQCTICFESIHSGQMVYIKKCSHRYCISCMRKHVEAKLLQGQLPNCPHENCKSKLQTESYSKFLDPKLYDLMNLRIKEASIPSTEKVYCPFPNCSALMSKTEVKKHTAT
nr:ribonuclease H domain-containing protein [Tanacetum cinerariifolium]